MGVFLEESDLAGWVTGSPDRVASAIADVEARARGIAPCLFDEDGAAEGVDVAQVAGVLRMVVVRYLDLAGGHVSQRKAGPFQVTYRDVSSAFDASDVLALRGLCAAAAGSAAGAMPRGSFPAPFGLDAVFPKSVKGVSRG